MYVGLQLDRRCVVGTCRTPDTVSVHALPAEQNGWKVGLTCASGHVGFTDGRWLHVNQSYVVSRGPAPGQWEHSTAVGSYSRAEYVLDRWAGEFPGQWATIEGRAGTAFAPIPLAKRRIHPQDSSVS